MAKEKTVIDFELIWKKINQQLSQEEELILSKWLNERPLHQQYFNRVKRYYHEGSSFTDARKETEKAWNALFERLTDRTRRQKRWLIGIPVAAASILIAVILLIQPRKVEPAFVSVIHTQNLKPIQPGTSKATLVLNDGTVHNITPSGNLILRDGGALISSEGTKLKYTEKDSLTKELKYNTLSVPRGGEFTLQLSDGTRVWLNSETVLRYPVQFASKERRVELTGEAYFEVTRNENVPFLVESGIQTVKVLGTEFNISSYRENECIYTTLIKGSVEVFSSNKPGIRQILAPNQQSTLEKSEENITKRNVDTYPFVAWKEGRFVFRNQNLEDIMTTLSKWYDVEVLFSNEEIRKIKFTGNLKRYDDFIEILRKIEMTHEVEFQITDKKITIR